MVEPNPIDAAIAALAHAETACNLARETLKHALEDAEAAEKHMHDMSDALRQAVKARRAQLVGDVV